MSQIKATAFEASKCQLGQSAMAFAATEYAGSSRNKRADKAQGTPTNRVITSRVIVSRRRWPVAMLSDLITTYISWCPQGPMS